MPDTRPPRPGLAIIAANYVPLLFLASGAAVVTWTPGLGAAGRAALALAWLYLVPPVVARVVLLFLGRPAGRFASDTPTYRAWWLLTQLQMVFNRLPALEELLRLVPGAYALWLNLWGSRVSPLVFWAPGVTVTDRYLLDIASGVVLGLRCSLGSHLVLNHEQAGHVLIIGPIVIERGCLVGSMAGIGPGCRVHAGESVPFGRLLPPFNAWRDGRMHRTAAAA